MTKETGGAAFPAPNYICDSARIDKDAFQKMGLTQGMTLRDWFAGQALMGMCASLTSEEQESINGVDIVNHAFRFADAMLAARKDSDEAKAE